MHTKRMNWIDYAKAFAIIFVVIGHVQTGNALTNWIYSFHMPLFFFLSGITLKTDQKSWKQFSMKLSKRILVPYFLYSIPYLFFLLAQSILFQKNVNLAQSFLAFFLSIRETKYYLGLWFLPVLFLSEVIVYLIILLKKQLQCLMIALIVTIAFVYAAAVKRPLPWALDAAPIAAFFIWIGYRYKNVIDVEHPLKVVPTVSRYIICAGMLALNVFFCYCNTAVLGKNVDMYKMRYGNPALYMAAAIAGIGFVICLCQIFLDTRNLNFLLNIGKNTLHIYCLHGILLTFMKKALALSPLKLTDSDSFSIAAQIIVAVCIVLICIMIIRAVKKEASFLRSKRKNED